MANKFMKFLSKELKRRRLELSISQAEMSRLSGISQASISQIEDGLIKGVNLSTLDSLSKFFNCKVSELIGEFK